MSADNIFSFFDKPDATPNVKEFKLPDFTQGLTDFNKQKDLIPGLQATATAGNEASNAAYQKGIFSLAPGLQGALSTLSNQASQLSQGIIPTDVANQVTRNAAYQGFLTGTAGLNPTGGRSSMQDALTARDLGRTSLDLINQGNQLAGSSLGMAQQLTPNNLSVNQLLFTPGQLLSRADQQAQIDYGIQSQNQQIDFMNNQRKSPFTSLLQNTVASFVSKPFTQFQEIQNLEANMPNMAAGAAMSFFGGGKPGAPLGSTNTSMPSGGFGNASYGPSPSGGNSNFGAGYNFGNSISGGSGVDASAFQSQGGFTAGDQFAQQASVMNTPTTVGGGGGSSE